ncbi:hypothetical protein H4Q26_005681 [Puccinia striiformis f. sp. tritici PST-130]|nr:hypothetical protein H4Q26_005681 [Puccinia striiformis f. sp. tritici PST-130]
MRGQADRSRSRKYPERPVHVQGAGAYGTFTVTTNFAQSHTMMDCSRIGPDDPSHSAIFECLSRLLKGENGWLDTARNVRGFAMKFHTKQGLWDCSVTEKRLALINNIKWKSLNQVLGQFLLDNSKQRATRHPAKFPAFVEAQGRDPVTNLRDADRALYLVLRQIDVRNPTGSIKLYGGRTSTSKGSSAFVRNDDSPKKELYSSIESGKFPRWKLYAQVMSAKEAENFKYNVLDSTKDWPTSLVAQQEIGVLELNKNPTDYHTEASQTSIIAVKSEIDEDPKTQGWAASHDPILQMRMAIYADSSRYRLHQNSDPVKIAKRDLLNTQMPNGNGPPQILKNSAQVLSNPSPKQIPGGPITDAAPKYD